MAYVKPGVEISQIETSVTPVLNAPDLETCLLGAAYYWQDPTLDDSEWSVEFDASTHVAGDGLEIYLSGYNSTYYEITSDDADLVIVDAYVTSGDYAGTLYHFSDADTGVSVDSDSHTVTITSGLSLPSELTGEDTDWVIPKAKIKIGYRSQKTDLAKIQNIERVSDIRTKLGEIVSWNPLAYGTYLAQINAGTSVNAYAVSGIESTDYSSGLDELEPHEIYAIAIMENKNDLATTLKTHVEAQSAATVKHERIGIVNKRITTSNYMVSAEKATVASDIKAQNFAIASKRIVSTHPDVAYILETRHILTVDPTWILNSHKAFTDTNFSTIGANAKLSTDMTLTDGTKYWTGDYITAAMVTKMLHNGIHSISCYVPVPGYYYCAVVAGQVAGQEPSAPLTNVSTAGLAKTYGSQDYFSEAHLNTMAEGGTYIMTQPTPNAAISSRHQMSTDVSSIAKRELSVTKALDFVSKFLRAGLRSYIGKYAITPNFLRMLTTILNGQGRYLVREGHVNDFKVLNVLQDPIGPDSILVEIEVQVKYPANYIKIQLLF